jgi:alpha-galactosidase
MGWSTWCTIGECAYDYCNQDEILSVASTLKTSGLQSVGYNWIAIDDCWASSSRDPSGSLQADPSRFYNFTDMIASLHDDGFLVSLYTSLGFSTCVGNRPGSFDFWEQDAYTLVKTFSADGVKGDWCGTQGLDPQNCTQHMSNAIQTVSSGAPIWFNFHCAIDGTSRFQDWCPMYGTSSRIGQDLKDKFKYLEDNIAGLRVTWNLTGSQPVGRGGGYWFNDMDLMPIGGPACGPNSTSHCPALTEVEYKSIFSFESLGNSLLIFSTDPRNLTSIMSEILFNTELIAVNQDSGLNRGIQPLFNQSCGSVLPCEVWHKTNSTGAHFVLVFNPNSLGSANGTLVLNLTQVSPSLSQPVTVRDMWLHQDLGVFSNTIQLSNLQPHEARTLQIQLV